MKRQKTETNTEQIVVRVSPYMKAELEAYCQKHGLSMAELIRCKVLGFLEGEDTAAHRGEKETQA